MIYQTAYFSTASAGITDRDIARILRRAHVKNAQRGVTGMLLLMDTTFFQVLEGEKDVVEALLQRIEANPLHSGLIRVGSSEREERIFPDWSMGYEKIAHADVARSVSGISPFDMSELAKNKNMARLAELAPEILIFMRSLYRSRDMDGAPEL